MSQDYRHVTEKLTQSWFFLKIHRTYLTRMICLNYAIWVSHNHPLQNEETSNDVLLLELSHIDEDTMLTFRDDLYWYTKLPVTLSIIDSIGTIITKYKTICGKLTADLFVS